MGAHICWSLLALSTLQSCFLAFSQSRLWAGGFLIGENWWKKPRPLQSCHWGPLTLIENSGAHCHIITNEGDRCCTVERARLQPRQLTKWCVSQSVPLPTQTTDHFSPQSHKVTGILVPVSGTRMYLSDVTPASWGPESTRDLGSKELTKGDA